MKDGTYLMSSRLISSRLVRSLSLALAKSQEWHLHVSMEIDYVCISVCATELPSVSDCLPRRSSWQQFCLALAVPHPPYTHPTNSNLTSVIQQKFEEQSSSSSWQLWWGLLTIDLGSNLTHNGDEMRRICLYWTLRMWNMRSRQKVLAFYSYKINCNLRYMIA